MPRIPRYQEIKIESLVGYKDGGRICRSVSRLRGLIEISALLGFIGSFVAIFRESIPPAVGWFLSLFCLSLLVLGRFRDWRSEPLSPATGKPLKRYVNLSAPEFHLEVLYVDEATQTFYRDTFLVEPQD
jgi:hypothetical protein